MPIALLVALIVTAPLLWRAAPSCGHDFGFHMQSWLAVRHAWAAGLAVPHWVAPANWGAGEARFQFYPPLSWLMGAALGLALPWSWVPAAYTAVCVGGATAAMYAAVRPWRPRAQATLAAALYGACPYLLFTAYERTAYGELLAAVWMPLLLRALLLRPLPMGRTALLVAALWYSNAPAGVMGSYLVLFSAAFWFASTRRGLLRHGTALALGGLLASDYLLPASYERRFVAIDRAVGLGLRVRDSFLFGRTGEAFHDQVLRTASWIAVATLGAGLLAAGAWQLRSRRGDPAWRLDEAFDAKAVLFLASLLALVVLLQLPVSARAWEILPEMRFLQFPWRLLLPASAAAALLAGLALPPRLPQHSQARIAIAAAALFAAGMAAWAGLTRFQPCDEEDTVAAHLLFAGSDAGFAGTDEYAAAGSDNGEIQQGLPRVRLLASPAADEGDDTRDANPAWKPARGVPGSVEIAQWDFHGFALRARPHRPAFAVLRWERYPGWAVRVDGEPCGARCMDRDDGLVTVALPGGRTSRVTAEWRAGNDVRLGRGLSVLGVLLLPLLFWAKRPGMMGRK